MAGMSNDSTVVEPQRRATASQGELNDIECRLFRLPVELRRHIYSFVFAGSEMTVALNSIPQLREKRIYRVYTSSEHQSFLLVSKSCYQEAISTFYAHTTIFVEAVGHEGHRLDLWNYILKEKLPHLRELATHIAIQSGFRGFPSNHPQQANFTLYDVSQMSSLKKVTFYLRRARKDQYAYYHSLKFYNPSRNLRRTTRQSTRYALKFANKFPSLQELTLQFVWCYGRSGVATMTASEWLNLETKTKVCEYKVKAGKFELRHASEGSQSADQYHDCIFCEHQFRNPDYAQMKADIQAWWFKRGIPNFGYN